jgi:DNA-binding transcriptional LysR family regulator
LEDDLALRLFDRATRHVAPTEVGRRLATRMARLIEGLDAATIQSTLRVVARRSYALRHLVPHARLTLSASPTIRLLLSRLLT